MEQIKAIILSIFLFVRYYFFLIPIDFVSICGEYIYLPSFNSKNILSWKNPIAFKNIKQCNWKNMITLFILGFLTINSYQIMYHFQLYLSYLRLYFLCDVIRLIKMNDFIEGINLLLSNKFDMASYFLRREICKYV